MEEKPYGLIQISKDVFEFRSIGKKQLLKQVRFTIMELDPEIYNMGLGTVLENGTVNFLDSSNNGDVIKVFATVVSCAKVFTGDFSGKTIFFTGNTEQKTKIYNEILRRHFDAFSVDFYIPEMDSDGAIHRFDMTMHYSGFFLIRKFKRLI